MFPEREERGASHGARRPARRAWERVVESLQLSRRSLLGVLAAAAPFVLSAPRALAWEEWCSGDPLVRVRVQGRERVVNVTIAVQQADRALLRTVQATGAVVGDDIVITIQGPRCPFKATAAIHALGLATGDPDAVYAAGQQVRLVFAGAAR